MITIATYRNLMSAELAKTRLENCGIKTLIADVFSYTLGYGSVIGGVRLQVSDAEAGRAKEILASEEFIDLSDAGAPVAESPNAGTVDTEVFKDPLADSSSSLPGAWRAWLLLLLGIFCLVLGRPVSAWGAMGHFSGQIILVGEILIVAGLWSAYGRLSKTDEDGAGAERKKDG